MCYIVQILVYLVFSTIPACCQRGREKTRRNEMNLQHRPFKTDL